MSHTAKMLLVLSLVLLSGSQGFGRAATFHVPKQFKTIQKAINAAKPGDVVLVASGTYKERIRMKPEVTVRSQGDDTKGKTGLLRAQKTILEGNGAEGKKAGVEMAEGATLDGFTITKVGLYNDTVWKEHHATQGEKLKDEQGVVGHGVAAVEIQGVSCVVKHCIVHHNGHVGIAVSGRKGATTAPVLSGNVVFRNMGGGIGCEDGAEAIIQRNQCFQNLRAGIGVRNSTPIILNNTCYENIRAGIGNRGGSKAIIRGNICYKNRRAGIGSRMHGTSPIIEGNRCYKNDMAGIGSRDGAGPIIRNNQCSENNMAGIGSDGAKNVLITQNECRNNQMAGIGVKNKASVMILNNKCINNKLVAIGVIRQSKAHNLSFV